jgi:hypothetical protein
MPSRRGVSLVDFAGDAPSVVVGQRPQPGTIAPFGATVRIVVAQ